LYIQTTYTHIKMETQNKSKKIAALVTRVLLGLIFFVFGLNGFLHFIPMEAPTDPKVAAFMGGLFQSGYFFPFLKGTEVLIGIALLVNRYTALALVVLAPIAINILVFHTFLAPKGTGISIIIIALLAYQAWLHKENYKTVLLINNFK
jgi:putative oxidoreductase